MSQACRREDPVLSPAPGMFVCTLFDGSKLANVPAGACAGVTVFKGGRAYASSLHDDYEGVFVLEGCGEAIVGSERMALSPGFFFVAPPHTPHTLIPAPDALLRVFWFHTGVCPSRM